MAPPVNRQNELSSRTNYYLAFAREHFDGHWDLLSKDGFHIGEEGNMTHGLGGLTQLMGENSSAMQRHDGGGESNAAVHYPWREEQIEQFVYLIKSGEEKRQWILNDYEFEDPFSSSKSGAAGDEKARRGWSKELEERLTNFEAQSNSLVKEMYRRKGWIHSGDHENLANEKDDFFSDSDSDDER